MAVIAEKLEVVAPVYEVERVEDTLAREDIDVERAFDEVGVEVDVLLAGIESGIETEDVVEVRREVSEEDGWGDVIDVETDEVKEVEVAEEIEAALDDEGAGAGADAEASFEVLEVLEATGAGITTVTGGELTSMMEYFVAVVVATGLRETVTRIV